MSKQEKTRGVLVIGRSSAENNKLKGGIGLRGNGNQNGMQAESGDGCEKLLVRRPLP